MPPRPARCALLPILCLMAACSPVSQDVSAGRPDAIDAIRCFAERPAALISAHRGGPAPGYPENALETLKRTHAKGPLILEVDVAQTRDGELVLMHDDTLDRTTTGTGAVSNQSSNYIAGLKLKDRSGAETAFAPPSLKDVLQWADEKAIIALDIKRSTSYETLVDVVREMKATDDVIYIVTSLGQLRALSRIAPDGLFSVPISSEADLRAAFDLGLKSDQILAWLGVNQLNTDLARALDSRGVATMHAHFGRGLFRDAKAQDHVAYDMGAGVDILALDDAAEGYKAISTDSVEAAREACL